MRNLLLDLVRTVKGPGASAGLGRLRDGFWWRKLSEAARFAYVIVYLDALEVERATGGAAWAGDAGQSREKVELDAAKVTHLLDQFFSDSHNWQMALPSAIFYVIKWHNDPAADHSVLLRRLRGVVRSKSDLTTTIACRRDKLMAQRARSASRSVRNADGWPTF